MRWTLPTTPFISSPSLRVKRSRPTSTLLPPPHFSLYSVLANPLFPPFLLLFLPALTAPRPLRPLDELLALRETPAVCLFLSAVSSYLHLRQFTLRELEEALISPGDNAFFSAVLTRLLIKDRSLRGKLSADEGLDWPLTGSLLRETVHSWYVRREQVWGLVENTLTRTRSTVAPAPGAIERVLGGRYQNELRKKMLHEKDLLSAAATAAATTRIGASGGQDHHHLQIPLIVDILHSEVEARSNKQPGSIPIQLHPLAIKELSSTSSSQSMLPSIQLPTAVSAPIVTEATASTETVEISPMIDVEAEEGKKPLSDPIQTVSAPAPVIAAPLYSSSRAATVKLRLTGVKRKEADASAGTPGDKDSSSVLLSPESGTSATAGVTSPSTKRGGGKRKANTGPFIFPVSEIPDHAPGYTLSSSSSSYVTSEVLEMKARGDLQEEQALVISSSSLSFSSLPPPSLSSDYLALSPPQPAMTRGTLQAQETSLVELYKQDLKNAVALTDDDIYNTLLDLPHDEADEEDIAEAYEWDALLEPLGVHDDPLAKTRFVDAPLKLRMTLLQTLIDGRAGDWNDDICQFLVAYADNGNDCDRLRLRELGSDREGAVYFTYPRMSNIAQHEVRIFRETSYRIPTSGRLQRTWDAVATDVPSLETLIRTFGTHTAAAAASTSKKSSTSSGSNLTVAEKSLVQALSEIRDLHAARIEKEIARQAYEDRRKEGKVGQVPSVDDSIFEAEEAAERARETAEKARETAEKVAQAAKAAAIERARLAAEHDAIVAAESLANTRKRRSSAIKQEAVQAAVSSESSSKPARSEHHHHHEKKPYAGPSSVTFERLLQILERLPHHDKVIAIQHVLRSTPEHDRFVVMSPNALPHNRRVVSAAARDMLEQLKEMSVQREENRLRRVEKDIIRRKKDIIELEKFRADKEEAARKLAAAIQQGRGDRATRRDGGLTVSDQARLDRQQEVVEKRSMLTAAIEVAKQDLVKLRDKVQENITRITQVSTSLAMDPSQMARISQEIQVMSSENVGLMNEVNAQNIRVQEAELTLKQFDDSVNVFLQNGGGDDHVKKSYLDYIKVRNEFLMQPSKICLRIKLQVPIAPGGHFLSGKRILQAFMYGSPWVDKAIEHSESLHPGLRWIRGEAALRAGLPPGRPNLPQAGPESMSLVSTCFLGDGAASGRPLEEPPKYFGSGRYGFKKQQGLVSPSMMSPQLSSPSSSMQFSSSSSNTKVTATLVGDRVEAVPSSTTNSGLFLKLRFNATIRPPQQSSSSSSSTSIVIQSGNSVEPVSAPDTIMETAPIREENREEREGR